MIRKTTLYATAVLLMSGTLSFAQNTPSPMTGDKDNLQNAPGFTFIEKENAIDVMCGNKYVTSYRYGKTLTKPILYPLKSPSGVVVTRGFPLENVAGESTDHPHHTGMFFTYGNVNNEDLWNNATPPPQIKHIKTTKTDDGQLSIITHWIGRRGKVLLEEKRDMFFTAEPNEYAIDFNIVLTTQDKEVVFGDTKEGMFAIRVADWLREEGGTGEYLNSDGNTGEPNVWGRRAKWCRLQGQKNGKTIGIAIFNHPDSTNYPTYWMARGYGLFAANPLGQYVFQEAQKFENPKPFNLTLQPGQSALFRFKLIIYEGAKKAEEFDKIFDTYAKKGVL